MGAVEAISLSILVGSSVDYCVHLVEGYLLAGENLPPHQAEVSSLPALPLSVSLPAPVQRRDTSFMPRCVLEAVAPRAHLPGDVSSEAAPPKQRYGPGRVHPSLSEREGADQAASKGLSCVWAPESASHPAARGAGLGPGS